MATESKPFYDAVTCVLSCALQGDSEIQRLAEERIKALEMVDEYPFTLAEIIGNSEEALAEKHMASVFLKNYFQDIFSGKRDSQVMKTPVTLYKLCLCLIDLLRLNFMSIKTMVSKSLAYIAYKGFWGVIDHKIQPMLKSVNEEQVYNAVFFLKHCMTYEEYKTSPPFRTSPEYFEILLSIFQRNITAEIRYYTIQPMYYVISYCLNTEVQENALSRLGLEFYNVLSEPYSINSDFKLKSEIIRYITKFETLGATKHCHIITNSLPAIGQLMINCCDQFKEIVKQTSSIPKDSSEDFDEESSNFIDLITLLIELIKDIVYSMYFDLLLEDLDNLLYCLFIFMCPYDDMEEELFIEDGEKSRIFPIRSNAVEILMNIKYRVTRGRRKGPEIFYKSVHNVFHKLMEEGQLVTTNGQLYHARITESLMYGLGNMNYYSQTDAVFPHSFYLDNWTAQMQQETNPIVNGRLLWLGGIFSHLLSPNTLTVHLKAIIQNLQGESRYLHVPCTEALRNHLVTYDKETMPVENRYIIKSLSKELFECLLTMIRKMSDNPTSCLNALGIFVKHDEQCAFAYIHNLQETLITIIYNHLPNVSVMKEVNFIVENIALKKSLQDALHHTLVPFLCKLLHGEVPEQLQDRKDTAEKALEFLNTIAVYTPQPIREALIVQGFSEAANLMLDNEQEHDRNTSEAAVNLITTLLVRMGSQVNYIRNSKEVALAEYVPKIIFECLESQNAVSGLVLGKLCVVSIVNLPDTMEPHFESILKSVLSAIQTDKSLEKLRGLWMIFIYIFMCRPANTTNFLSSIPGPRGGSALNFLINLWRPEYVSVIQKFERTVLGVALIQIITSAIEGNGDKLKEVEVQLTVSDRSTNKMTGIEYLYILLIFLVLMEQALSENITEHCFDATVLFDDDDGKSEENEILLNYPPFNIDIIAVVSQFLKHENVYYLNVCRNFLYHEELLRLSNMGCAVPQISME